MILPNIFFDNIKRLDAAHYLIYDFQKEKIDVLKMVFLEKNIANLNDSSQIHEELEYKIDRAIKRHLVSDVKIGLNVSGGLDSATLIHFANKYISSISTFTQEYEGYLEKEWIDKFSNNYSLKDTFINLKQKNIIDRLDGAIKYQDEPFGGLFVIGYSHLYSEATTT